MTDFAKQNLINYYPQNNASIAENLFIIENSLREHIVFQMDKSIGLGWRKRNIQGDVRETISRGLANERSNHWRNTVSPDPLYYIDFPDISKIICSNTNWPIFSGTFGNIDQLKLLLKSSETPRNRVAHNRIATDEDRVTLELLVATLIQWLGPELLEAHLRKCTGRVDLKSLITSAASDLRCAKQCILTFLPIDPPLASLAALTSCGYFDSDFLGTDISPVEVAAKSISAYSEMGRRRGEGYLIERSVVADGTITKTNQAIELLESLV